MAEAPDVSEDRLAAIQTEIKELMRQRDTLVAEGAYIFGRLQAARAARLTERARLLEAADAIKE